MSDFVHLHCHTDYSLLDGATKINDLVEKAHRTGMRAVAITDHGNMFGAIEFYKKCKNTGVKPLIGMEGYIASKSRFDRTRSESQPNYHHLILIAKNKEGYHNLMKLSSIGYLEGFYYRPRFDKEVLEKHSKGLVVTSACLQGEVAYHLARDNKKKAMEAIGWYKEVFGDDYYLEVQDHGIPEQDKVNAELVELSKKFEIPLIATNDLHYLNHDDHFAHDVLLCIGTASNLHDQKRFRFDSDNFYMKTEDEMKKLFRKFPQALSNTIEIAEKVNLEIDFGQRFLPYFEPPGGGDPVDYFRKLCKEGVKKRYPKVTKEIKERLSYEMGIIEQMGFVSYFLIVQDFVQFAKKRGIPVGPGRGSAAGSLVAYALGITDVDPLKYDLLFERFLNAERVSMPDIDIDFSNEGREEVIHYVTEKYGKDRVAQIITFGTLAARGVIRDVGRVLEIPLSEVDKIAKMIPGKPGMTLAKAFEQVPELKEYYDQGDERIKNLFDIAKRLEGMSRHASTHAAGVVIGSKPLIEIVPLYKAGEEISTQYTMTVLEELGLLKMDFLGLKTLSIIDKAVQLVEKVEGKKIDPLQIPLDDPKTFELLSRGDTKGVFQLESSGMRDVLVRLKPDCFEDIIALLALYRPGPLGSGMVDTYIRRKHGEEKIKYDHPLLEPILKETKGVILYQEQVMRIANKLAGFSLNEADNLRKAMGKKKPEILAKFREKFIQGAIDNGVEAKIAQEIFATIEYFAGYGFNKSHSTAYAFVTYQTAYLKANYPVLFMAALLTCEMGNPDKIVEYVEECRSMGIEIVPPDIHTSEEVFTVKDGKIYYALNAIKGVGAKAVDSILEVREKIGKFKDLFHFCENVDLRVCNKGVMEALIKSGAMDSLGAKRSQLSAVLDQAIKEGNKYQKDLKSGQASLFGDLDFEDASSGTSLVYPEMEEWSSKEKLAYEKEALGFYLSGHPINKYQKLVEKFATHKLADLKSQPNGKEVLVAAMILSIKKIVDRKGKNMAFITLDDGQTTLEGVVFGSVYPEVSSYLAKDEVLFVEGKLSFKEDIPSIMVNRLIPPEEMESKLTVKSLTLYLPTHQIDASQLLQLREVLLRHSGSTPLYLQFLTPEGTLGWVQPSRSYFIQWSPRLKMDLEALPFLRGFAFNKEIQSQQRISLRDVSCPT
ncbi:MAG: DNA polymerase III subunit alpha [Planctomycetota bacterium]|nr:MAG: DNA polymerase III subunit alpha [Planctomycetota bacterium]